MGLVAPIQALGIGPAVRRDGQVGDGAHPDTAGRDFSVVVDEFAGDEGIGHHAFEGGALDDPVAQLDGAQPGRREGVDRGKSGFGVLCVGGHASWPPSITTPEPVMKRASGELM